MSQHFRFCLDCRVCLMPDESDRCLRCSAKAKDQPMQDAARCAICGKETLSPHRHFGEAAPRLRTEPSRDTLWDEIEATHAELRRLTQQHDARIAELRADLRRLERERQVPIKVVVDDLTIPQFRRHDAEEGSEVLRGDAT